jgi:hypothetical protein
MREGAGNTAAVGPFPDAATARQGLLVRKSRSRGPGRAARLRRTEGARARRITRADALRAENQGLVEPERLLDELDRACTLLLEIQLMAAGFPQRIHHPSRRQPVDMRGELLEAYTGLVLDDQTLFTLYHSADMGEQGMKRLRELLGKRPEIYRALGDLSLRAEMAWVDLIVRGRGVGAPLKEILLCQVRDLKAQLSGSDPSPLERLLVERITVCWLQVCYSDIAAAVETELDQRLAEFELKRLDRAQRRFHRAIRELTSFRKLRRSIRTGPKSRGSSNTLGHAPRLPLRRGAVVRPANRA